MYVGSLPLNNLNLNQKCKLNVLYHKKIKLMEIQSKIIIFKRFYSSKIPHFEMFQSQTFFYITPWGRIIVTNIIQFKFIF